MRVFVHIGPKPSFYFSVSFVSLLVVLIVYSPVVVTFVLRKRWGKRQTRKNKRNSHLRTSRVLGMLFNEDCLFPFCPSRGKFRLCKTEFLLMILLVILN